MTDPDKPIHVSFQVTTPSQAAELNAAWQEIVAGHRTRLNTAAEATHEIMERARIGLSRIVTAVEEHPGTGQGRRLVRFLAGVYNGNDYPFDLTDLRALDTELASACIDYLTTTDWRRPRCIRTCPAVANRCNRSCEMPVFKRVPTSPIALHMNLDSSHLPSARAC
jgi:hypothetical protein